jgi:hypothetical protein
MNINASEFFNISINKKHLEFSCYIKIEKNGVEVKNKNASSSAISKVSLVEKTKKGDGGEAKNFFHFVIRNKKNEQYFTSELEYLDKWVDKFVGEGKLTILISKGNEKIAIFISKTTKDVLDNFIKRINDIRNPLAAKTASLDIDIDKSNAVSNKTHTNNNNINSKLAKKKQLAELYAKNIQPGQQNLKIKRNENGLVKVSQQRKLGLNDLPNDIIDNILEYIDRKTLTKISLINKDFKNIFDNYIDKMVFRHDTPSNTFNVLLYRFKNLNYLSLGKAKNLINENFKYFNVNLKNLNYLDISEIQNLNENSIFKLFSKIKNTNITNLKINIFLDNLPSILIYIQKFFINLENLYIHPFYDHITTNTKCTKFENLLRDLETEPKFFNTELYKCLTELLIKKKHLNTLAIYFVNASLMKNYNIFNNLCNLEINILLIEKIKDLRILSNCVNLVSLSLKEIVIFENSSTKIAKLKKQIKRINFDNLLIKLTNNDSNSNNNLSLDFDNDYIENFANIFSKMKKLENLTFGSFTNKEILKLISLYLKDLKSLTLNSNLITDEHLTDVFLSCNKLQVIDLRGCNYIQGSCFVDVDPPKSLASVKLSLMSYNFGKLITYLKGKGITAENYIFK